MGRHPAHGPVEFPTQKEPPISLYLNARDFRRLLALLGPSLALWRAAEIAVLRTQAFEPPVLDLACGLASVR